MAAKVCLMARCIAWTRASRTIKLPKNRTPDKLGERRKYVRSKAKKIEVDRSDVRGLLKRLKEAS